MELLDKYFEIQKQIYEYFGYVEDWVVIPIEDACGYIWRLYVNEYGYGSVWFADSLEELESGKGNCYENEIYIPRHLPKCVYRGEAYTMICVDTHVDGNKFLKIFSNGDEQPYISLLEAALDLYREER